MQERSSRPPSPFEALADFAASVLSASTRADVARITRASAAALTGSSSASVREFERETVPPFESAPGGEAEGSPFTGTAGEDSAAVDALLRETAASRTPQWVRRDGALGSVPAVTLPPGMRPFLAVPAVSGDAVAAVIAICGAPRDYTDEDSAFLNRLGSLYCLARRRLDLEEDLRESERRYRDILESSHELVQSVRPDGSFDFVNEAWLRAMKYDAADVARLNVFDVIAPDLIPHCQEIFGRIMQGESVGEHETAFVAKDGSRVILQGSMVPRLAGGRVVATHAFFRDVTELRRTEEFVRDVLEAIDEAFVHIDRDFRILNANRAYCKQVGKTLAEVAGRHCFEVSHGRCEPCARVGVTCPVRHVFESGEPHSASHQHRGADGSLLLVETKAFPLRGHDGAVSSAIEIINDVTAKQQLEEQLRNAQKMEAVGLLAGGVAHDFNNLLQAILGYGSLLQARIAADDPLGRHVAQILQAGNQAAELTRGLLAFSRKQVVNPAPADLNEIVRGLGRIIERVIGEDVEMRVAFAAEPLPVLVDQGQIGQVLMNLATNARDAMPRGGALTIETSRFLADEHYVAAKILPHAGPYAVLTVSDTGIGMDRATSERIFEPFYTTKEVGRGTGLGLSIVYGIVRRHGGQVNVYSEPGRGTTFKVMLPLTAEAPRRVAEEPLVPPRGTETVLLAEDDTAVRGLLATVLADAGYTVLEAADGEAAIEAYVRHRAQIKLVLLDVIMPKKNGQEVREAIRALDPAARTLFLSGYTDDVIARHGLLEEGVELIGKPVEPAVFLRKVRSALDRA